MKIKIETINIFDPEKKILNEIVEKIKETEMSYFGCGIYNVAFAFEIEKDDLLLIIEGKLEDFCKIEEKTHSTIIEARFVTIDILSANFKGIEAKSCFYNDRDFEEQIKYRINQ